MDTLLLKNFEFDPNQLIIFYSNDLHKPYSKEICLYITDKRICRRNNNFVSINNKNELMFISKPLPHYHKANIKNLNITEEIIDEHYPSYYFYNKLEYVAGDLYLKSFVIKSLYTDNSERLISQKIILQDLFEEKNIIDNENKMVCLMADLMNPNNYQKNACEAYKETDDLNITLYDYQKNDILKMEKIEKDKKVLNVYKRNTISSAGVADAVNMGLGLKKNNECLQTKCNIEFNKIKNKLKGGLLINEMGLGKTIECIEFIKRSKDPIINKIIEIDDNSDNCNYFFKRNAKMGTYCENKKIEGGFFCKKHLKSPFIDKLKTKVDMKRIKSVFLKKSDISISTDYTKFNFKLYSFATLIICPTQLLDQWVKEYYTRYKKTNNFKICAISTITTLKNTTLTELLYSDIIIIPYNLLDNNIYLSEMNKKSTIVNKLVKQYEEKYGETELESNNLKSLLKEECENIHNNRLFNIHDIHWNRIMLDEFHEINSKNKILDSVFKLNSDNRWVITGTPFPNQIKNLQNYLTFLSNKNESIFDFLKDFDTKELYDIFIRNTKESISNEWKGVKINEYNKLLNFTNVERNIYENYNQQLVISINKKKNLTNVLLQICCCGEILDDKELAFAFQSKTFKEIQDLLLEKNKKKLDSLSINILDLDLEIKQFEKNIDENDPNPDVNTILGNLKRDKTNKSKEYEVLNRGQNFLISALQVLEQNEEWECPVCLSDNDEIENVGITICGHKFCWECLATSINVKSKYTSHINCPNCQKQLNSNEYFEIKTEKKEEKQELQELVDLVDKVKSTKIGNIIYDIRESFKMNNTNKYIIFSQWEDLLTKVGTVLNTNGINVVYCKGTIYQKNKSIKAFKNDPKTNCIMLSSQNAASGLNLTEANRIIFIEPIYGTSAFRKDIENQAIGRAARLGQDKSLDVYRYFIRNTIEEKIHN